MSANKSQNLKLHLWEPEDNFLRAEFNENFAAIDTAVKADRDAIKAEENARKSAVTTLQTSVNAKASTSALNTAKSELTTKINDVKTIAEAAYSPKNRNIVLGKLTIAGSYETTVLNVGFRPAFVHLYFGTLENHWLVWPTGSFCPLNAITFTWTDTGISWVIRSMETELLGKECTYIAVR